MIIFKQDKRSKRTRKSVKIALIKLLKTTSKSKITIKELTNKACINRNSFYTHYKSIDDIFDDMCNDVVLEIGKITSKYTYSQFKGGAFGFISDISNLIEENKLFSEYIIFSNDSAKLIENIKDMLCDLFYNIYTSERKQITPYIKYLIGFCVSGVFEMYYVWFKYEKDVPLEHLTNKITIVVEQTLNAMREIK